MGCEGGPYGPPGTGWPCGGPGAGWPYGPGPPGALHGMPAGGGAQPGAPGGTGGCPVAGRVSGLFGLSSALRMAVISAPARSRASRKGSEGWGAPSHRGWGKPGADMYFARLRDAKSNLPNAAGMASRSAFFHLRSRPFSQRAVGAQLCAKVRRGGGRMLHRGGPRQSASGGAHAPLKALLSSDAKGACRRSPGACRRQGGGSRSAGRHRRRSRARRSTAAARRSHQGR